MLMRDAPAPRYNLDEALRGFEGPRRVLRIAKTERTVEHSIEIESGNAHQDTAALDTTKLAKSGQSKIEMPRNETEMTPAKCAAFTRRMTFQEIY